MVPSITVAVCVFNTPKKLLDDCMKSMVSRDYSNFDILTVDNHSTEKETLESFLYWVENYPHNMTSIKPIEVPRVFFYNTLNCGCKDHNKRLS